VYQDFSSFDPGMASFDVPDARECRCVWELQVFRLHMIAVPPIVSAVRFHVIAVWFHELLTVQ